MKLGYLSIPPQQDLPREPGPPDARAGLAEALGFSEFYAPLEETPARAEDPESAALLRVLPDRPLPRAPLLASVDGVARRARPRSAALLAAPAGTAQTVQAQSRQGRLPLSASWLDDEALARHWAAHVTGSTHGARCARRSDWRIARSIVVDDDPARAEAQVKAPDSPCRLRLSARLPGTSAAEIEARLDACVIHGTPAQVMARLQALWSRLSGFGTLVYVDHPWPDAARARRSMVLFAEALLRAQPSPLQRKLRKLELA